MNMLSSMYHTHEPKLRKRLDRPSGFPPRKTEMPLVFENISKTVGGEIHIHPTNLRFESGSFNTLLGRTGAGKTTLLRLMAGLERPTTGRILMSGVDVARVAVRRRNVAMVYQQFINYPDFRNIASPLEVARVERGEIKRRVRRVAEMMHLDNLLDRLPSELSGGQQQRVALARALIKEADLLLLDEPLANLDFKLREELRIELRRALEGSGAIVVYATADPQEALILGGNTIIVDEGRVLQQGPAAEIYRQPTSVRAARLVGDPPMNVVEGRIEDAQVRMGENQPVAVPDHLRDLPDGDYIFGVRPHHVLMRRGAPTDITIHTRVDLAEISGSETVIHFEHGGSSWVSLQDGVHPLEVDEPIDACVEPPRVFAFDPAGALVAAPDHGSAGRQV
jgi:glycerol transport system ATP-binding protein